MRYENDLIVAIQQVGECGNGVFDSFIVGDHIVGSEGNIEVNAYNNFFIGDLYFVDEFHIFYFVVV